MIFALSVGALVAGSACASTWTGARLPGSGGKVFLLGVSLAVAVRGGGHQ